MVGWNVRPQHVMNLQRANEWIYSNPTVSELITAATGRLEVQVGRDARGGGGVGERGGITGTVLPLVVLSCDELWGCCIPSSTPGKCQQPPGLPWGEI